MMEVTGVATTKRKRRRRRSLPHYLGTPMPPTTLAVRPSCPRGDSEPESRIRLIARPGTLVEETRRPFPL
jgi:hypothetical protein